MDRTNNNQTAVAHTGHAEHTEPSIFAAVLYGAALTAALFAVLGFLVGNDRAPGSYYAYGLSCFVWPVLGMVALGAVVGGSLGFIFGSIGHASDPVTETTSTTVEPQVSKSPAPAHRHLTLHLPRH